MWGLAARTPCTHVALRSAGQRLGSVKHRHDSSSAAKCSTPLTSSKQISHSQYRRRTLTSLLGGTILAMGFSRSSVAASTASATVDTVGGRAHQALFALCMALLDHPSFLLVQVLQNPNFPDSFPFSAEDFQRYDETADTQFYSQPRFVTHIDDGAIGAVTK